MTGGPLFAFRRPATHSLLIALVALIVQLSALPHAVSGKPDGLRVAAMGSCQGGYEVGTSNLCSHGADPIPDWVRARGGPRVRQQSTNDVPAAVGCDGDSVQGKRVQAIYAYVAGRPNRLSTYRSSMRSWATDVDAMFARSAKETGGTARLRWVTSGCLLDIVTVPLSSVTETNFDAMLSELAALGYNSNDRKYLVWFDSNPNVSKMCGLGTIWNDDRAATDNDNNRLVGYARIDYMCWDFAEAHELMHNLGGVQLSAPHSTGGWHCTDENDQMCYADASGVRLTYPCADVARADVFDCGHDDYFHTAPKAGSYLAAHWNTARSGWLVGGEVYAAPGTDTVAPTVASPRIYSVWGQTISTTSIVRVTWPKASDPSGIAEYELQGRKGSGSWSSVPLPAPTSTTADVSVLIGATYGFRVRARDGAGNIGPWTNAPLAALTRLEENGAAVTYAGKFKRVAANGASGGYVRKSGLSGRIAKTHFTGSSIAFVSTTSNNRGIAAVRIDGGAWQLVDLYTASTNTKRVAWAADVSQGAHTLEVSVTGDGNSSSTGTRIDIDAFVVFS